MSPWKVLLSSREEQRTTEAGEFITLGPERIHSKLWVRSRIEVSRERGSNWGSGFYKRPWVKCCGLPRLSVDGSIQTKRTRLLVALWGWHWRGDCEVALGFSKPAGLKEGGLLVQVLTRLAGVSSRTCRLPAPQTDAEAATVWSSSGELSTVLCIILLIRTVTMSLQLQRGGKVQWSNHGKYMIKWFET